MKLANIFSDNMVFQAEKTVRCFGKGKGCVEVVRERLVEFLVDFRVFAVNGNPLFNRAIEHFIEFVEVFFGVGEKVVGNVYIVAVICLKQGEFYRFVRVFFQEVAHK